MWWTFVAAWLAILVVAWLLNRRKIFSKFEKLGISGPKPSLLFGNYLELYQKGPLECHKQWTEKYGKVFGYYYGIKPILLVSDPQLLKQIQLKDFHLFINRAEIFSNRKVTTSPGVHQLFNLKNQKWKEVRSVLTPSFTTGKMKQMTPAMNNAINDLVDKVQAKSDDGQPFNLQAYLQGLTMDVIGRTAFGLHTNVQKNPNDPYLKILRILLDGSFRSLLLFMDLCFPLLTTIAFFVRKVTLLIKNGGNNPLNDLLNMCQNVIEARRKDPTKRQPDMLQLLMDAEVSSKAVGDIRREQLIAGDEADQLSTTETNSDKKERKTHNSLLTDEQVQANALLMFLAGYETTSTALSFTCAVLARHWDVQDRIRQEITEIMQNEGHLDYTSINKAQYLDQVLSETMRIYPPIYQFVTRVATQDVQYDKLRIPRGTNILIPVYQLHHDPDYWDEPETFNPDRFSPENRQKIVPLTWQPFGAGPRNCIGMRFAQMESKLALANLLTKFRLELANPQEGPVELFVKQAILHPLNGVNVVAVPIT